jgi:hypothetical protein
MGVGGIEFLDPSIYLRDVAMPSFRQKSTARNYLSRREQWRILLLVASLGLVVVVMGEAAKPSSWTWLWAGAKQDAKKSNPKNEAAKYQNVDTRLPLRDDLGPGVVRIAAAPPLPGEAEEDGFFPGIKVELLRTVRDDEFFFPDKGSPQRKAWFNLFDVLNQTDEETLVEASTGDVTFTQIFDQPKTYRGKLVTVHGFVRRAQQYKMRKNDAGIEIGYELWVNVGREATSVYCLQLPDGFPTGADVSAEVEITGFFYNRRAYAHAPRNPDKLAEDANLDVSIAPVILARTVHWIPKKEAIVAEAPSTQFLMAALGAAALVALGFTWWVFARNPRQDAGPQLHNPAVSLDGLKHIEFPDDSTESIEAVMKQQEETPR